MNVGCIDTLTIHRGEDEIQHPAPTVLQYSPRKIYGAWFRKWEVICHHPNGRVTKEFVGPYFTEYEAHRVSRTLNSAVLHTLLDLATAKAKETE